jgi:hypothetical protein
MPTFCGESSNNSLRHECRFATGLPNFEKIDTSADDSEASFLLGLSILEPDIIGLSSGEYRIITP